MRALRTVLAGGAIAIASIVLWGAIPEEMLAQDAAPSLAGNEVLKVLGEDVVGAPESAPPLNDPGRVARWEPGEWRYRVMTGSRKGQTEQESLEPIGTPARAFRATLIRTDYRIDIFAVVSVRDTLYTFYADGVGKVAEAEHRRISAVGLFNSDTYIGKLLLSFTPLVPAAPPAKVESP